jgi:RNA polymerase sigma-70 factor (ECF subfamily)
VVVRTSLNAYSGSNAPIAQRRDGAERHLSRGGGSEAFLGESGPNAVTTDLFPIEKQIELTLAFQDISEHFFGSLVLILKVMSYDYIDMVLRQVMHTDDETTADAGPEIERLVREHAHMVYRITFSVLRNHADAEDAVQEVFVRLVKHRPHLDQLNNPRAWLAKAAWRIACDRVRSRGSAWRMISLSEQAESVLALRAAGAGAEEIAATNQMTGLLDRLIQGLPRDLRQTLELSLAEELTSAEIATVLGIPEVSVRTRLFRARQLLREKMELIMGNRSASA